MLPASITRASPLPEEEDRARHLTTPSSLQASPSFSKFISPRSTAVAYVRDGITPIRWHDLDSKPSTPCCRQLITFQICLLWRPVESRLGFVPSQSRTPGASVERCQHVSVPAHFVRLSEPTPRRRRNRQGLSKARCWKPSAHV